MDLQKLELLESRVSGFLGLLEELKQKNVSLETQMGDLRRELSEKQEAVKRLQEENQQLAQEREVIRGRVENMLEALNGIKME
ncbi:MAG: cell division protein ZapB [Nitrospinae bacterium]|nr:cell division protein ZapB [Nitrospinota bacterium]